MTLFGRLFGTLPRRVDDPVLGSLTRSESGWSGPTTWSHSDSPFALSVYRAGQVPQPSDRMLYERLTQDYLSLRPDIQSCLLSLWTGHLTNTPLDAPEFANSLTLWAELELQGVGLHGDNHVQLIYGFRGDGHPEGAFVVAVQGRRVEPVEYVE